jgi:hypothetical protein
MITRLTLFLLLALLIPPTFATGLFYDEAKDTHEYVGEERVAWQEQSSKLPPLPKEDDLLTFEVDEPKKRFKYFIDHTSLTAGEDGVMRFSLVIESMSGVKNSSYEGIRCRTKEYKVYAYGSRKAFKMVRKPVWRPILPRHRYYIALFHDYLCSSQSAVIAPLSPEQAIKSILTNTLYQGS